MILFKKIWANCSFFLFVWMSNSHTKNWAICCFIMSNLSESLTVTLLSWATWAIQSWLLFCHEWPEQFAHSRSFFLNNLSDSLTVAHLSSVIWANEQWANERNPYPAKIVPCPMYCTSMLQTKRYKKPSLLYCIVLVQKLITANIVPWPYTLDHTQLIAQIM